MTIDDLQQLCAALPPLREAATAKALAAGQLCAGSRCFWWD